MGESAIALIATQLALDDSGKALLKTMHQDYMKKWDEEIRTEQSRVDDLIRVDGREPRRTRTT